MGSPGCLIEIYTTRSPVDDIFQVPKMVIKMLFQCHSYQKLQGKEKKDSKHAFWLYVDLQELPPNKNILPIYLTPPLP